MIEWAQSLVGRHVDETSAAIKAFRKKPRSAKRLHRARKCLARLRAVLDDYGAIAGTSQAFAERIARLHRRAGKVRDADVLLRRARAYKKDAFGTERAELKRLCALLKKRRKRMRAKLLRELRA